MEARRGRIVQISHACSGHGMRSSGWVSTTELSKHCQIPDLRFLLQAHNTSLMHNLRLQISYFANYSFCFPSLAGQLLPGIIGTNYFINTLFLFWCRVFGGHSDHRYYGGVLLPNLSQTPDFLVKRHPLFKRCLCITEWASKCHS